MSDLCFVTVGCEQADYELFEQKARESGMDTGDWLVKVAKVQLASHPVKEATFEINAIENVAFTAMEGSPIKPLVAQQPKKSEMLPNNSSNHPCYNLLPGIYPHGFTATTCFGTCTSPAQSGKPCYFSRQVADSCGVFRRKG